MTTEPNLAVVELRQYTLHPGQRDRLIELFERELLDPQEAVGMTVIGQFRDLDDPDRFVWLRGFAGMPARRQALEAFYGGPVWAAHRDAANATMVDSDDVLLLRPLSSSEGFALPPGRTGPREGEGRTLVATIHHLAEPPGAGVAQLRERAATEDLVWLQSEPSVNDYPALPVREDEVAVSFGARSTAYLSDDEAFGAMRPAQTLRLAPTSRSLLR